MPNLKTESVYQNATPPRAAGLGGGLAGQRGRADCGTTAGGTTAGGLRNGRKRNGRKRDGRRCRSRSGHMRKVAGPIAKHRNMAYALSAVREIPAARRGPDRPHTEDQAMTKHLFEIELPQTFSYEAEAIGKEPIVVPLAEISIAGLQYLVENGLRQSLADSFAGRKAALDKEQDRLAKAGTPMDKSEEASWLQDWSRERVTKRWQSIKSGEIASGTRRAGRADADEKLLRQAVEAWLIGNPALGLTKSEEIKKAAKEAAASAPDGAATAIAAIAAQFVRAAVGRSPFPVDEDTVLDTIRRFATDLADRHAALERASAGTGAGLALFGPAPLKAEKAEPQIE